MSAGGRSWASRWLFELVGRVGECPHVGLASIRCLSGEAGPGALSILKRFRLVVRRYWAKWQANSHLYALPLCRQYAGHHLDKGDSRWPHIGMGAITPTL